MISDLKCYQCGYRFETSSRQFYCCDINKKYCIICRRDNCKTCLRTITKQIQVPRCRECYLVERNPNDMFREPQCESYYCGKCLVTRIMKKAGTYQAGPILFPCGHRVDSREVERHMEKHCKFCGAQFDALLDLELLNGEKCCFLCAKYENANIVDLIINCMGCGDLIKKMSDAGAVDNDFILCKKCMTFSQIEEKHFLDIQAQEEIKSTMESSGHSGSDQPSINIFQPSKELEQPAHQPNNHENRQNGDNKQNGDNRQKGENRQDDQKEGAKPSQQKKKSEVMEARGEQAERERQRRTILASFPSDRQIQRPKMKKHLSMETYVEKMKISIEPEEKQIFECDDCGYQIETGAEFAGEDSRKYCRLCYAVANMPGYLGFASKSNLLKPLDESRRKFKSGQKHSSTLLPPEDRTNTKFGKQSGHFDNHEKLSMTAKPTHITIHPYQSLPRENCSVCKKPSFSVVRTLRQGTVCSECYYKK